MVSPIGVAVCFAAAVISGMMPVNFDLAASELPFAVELHEIVLVHADTEQHQIRVAIERVVDRHLGGVPVDLDDRRRQQVLAEMAARQ